MLIKIKNKTYRERAMPGPLKKGAPWLVKVLSFGLTLHTKNAQNEICKLICDMHC
jgi:hypothetical protein